MLIDGQSLLEACGQPVGRLNENSQTLLTRCPDAGRWLLNHNQMLLMHCAADNRSTLQFKLGNRVPGTVFKQFIRRICFPSSALAASIYKVMPSRSLINRSTLTIGLLIAVA